MDAPTPDTSEELEELLRDVAAFWKVSPAEARAVTEATAKFYCVKVPDIPLLVHAVAGQVLPAAVCLMVLYWMSALLCGSVVFLHLWTDLLLALQQTGALDQLRRRLARPDAPPPAPTPSTRGH